MTSCVSNYWKFSVTQRGILMTSRAVVISCYKHSEYDSVECYLLVGNFAAIFQFFI